MTDMISPFSEEQPPRPQSILWKVLTIAGLILGLLIPLNMIGGIIAERQNTKDQVQAEIAQTWSPQQTVLGPVLVVPYKINYEAINAAGQKEAQTMREFAYILPQQFQVKSSITPETRHRGIYQSIVYTTDLDAQGSFDLKAIEELGLPKSNILWKDAFVALGVSGMKGIDKRPVFEAGGKQLEFLQGMNGASRLNTDLYALTAVAEGQTRLPFKLKLSLKGSEAFSIIPVGKQNTITISSPWASPSFIGSPKSQRDNKGFKATWDVSDFGRGYGNAFTGVADAQTQLAKSAVGVQLLTPVDSYRQSERAVKYGMLFLVLTFATFFLFEIIGQYRLHPFQYLLVGCAIALFYLLLIAISEVSRFELAYGIATTSIITTVTLYSKAILGRIRRHAQWLIAGLLSILYVYLYVLLQLEDWSLLFGAIGLFVVLAVIMYVTRNIDWYNEQVPA